VTRVCSTEVDGVPVRWAADGTPGRAVLVFRTGLVDEAFPQTGWTHAVEHLALHPLGVQPHAYDGSVDLLTTRFGTAGTPEQVTGFFRQVCGNLQRLPAQRWDDERRVLEVEAQQHGRGPGGLLLLHRFGALGHGALGGLEWGRHAATPDDLTRWARTRFTRQNAVLCLSGPPPAGLVLPLPEGEPRPVPPLRPLVDGRGVVVDGRLPGSTLSLLLDAPEDQAEALGQLVVGRVVRALRFDAALSYSPQVWSTALSGSATALTLHADTRPGDEAAATARMLEVVEELARDGAGPDERAADGRHRDAAAADDGPDAAWGDVRRAALRTLLPDGHAPVPHREAAPLLADGLRTALLGVPAHEAAPAGWPVLPHGSPHLPEGVPLYREEDPALPRRLVVTGSGIGLHLGPDAYATVPWAECAGVAEWDDGSHFVLGTDGVGVHVDPAHWPDGERLVGVLTAQRPPHLVAQQGPAEVDEAEREWRAERAASRDRVGTARVELDRSRRRMLAALARALPVLALVLLVLGGAVALLARYAGAVAGVVAPLLLGALLYAGWRSSRSSPAPDPPASGSPTPAPTP